MNRYWKRMMKYRPGLYMTLVGGAQRNFGYDSGHIALGWRAGNGK